MQRVTRDIKRARARLVSNGERMIRYLKPATHQRYRAEARRQCRAARDGKDVLFYDDIPPTTSWQVD